MNRWIDTGIVEMLSGTVVLRRGDGEEVEAWEVSKDADLPLSTTWDEDDWEKDNLQYTKHRESEHDTRPNAGKPKIIKTQQCSFHRRYFLFSIGPGPETQPGTNSHSDWSRVTTQ